MCAEMTCQTLLSHLLSNKESDLITHSTNIMAVVATTTGSSTAASTVTAPREKEKTPQEILQEQLLLPILSADRVIKSVHEAESSKQDCSDLARQVERLSDMLRFAVRLSASNPSLYDRPLLRVVSDITKNLDRAHTLVRKCRHSGVLRQVFTITTTADFRKVSALLESSIGDMKWLLSIFESDGGTILSLPPIASNDPMLAWVWSYICTIQMGQLKDRVDAANELASLARDSDRNKKIIVEEGGVLPLLKLLKEGASPEAQIASAIALFNIATDKGRVGLIVDALGVPIIVGVLGESLVRVQIPVANLVARMAEFDPYAQEEFMSENVTRPLVTSLSAGLALDVASNQSGKTSIHSLVQMNKELGHRSLGVSHNHGLGHHSDGSSSHHRREKEMESPEMQLKLKISCAEALWKLSMKSVSNSKKITETKGLLCLARLIEEEKGELQYNCLMTVVEITAVAESNPDLRRAAFKTNSPAAKAVFDQLLRVIEKENNPNLQIPAIRAIGYLARTFPAKETRMIGPLVAHLGNGDMDMATEAAFALEKFVHPENFNCAEHSKAIIEFNGVPPLMRLIRAGDQAQKHGLVLLCFLALSAGNSKALEQARALNALEGGARTVVAQHPELRELFGKAIHHLTLYQPGAHPLSHRQTFAT